MNIKVGDYVRIVAGKKGCPPPSRWINKIVQIDYIMPEVEYAYRFNLLSEGERNCCVNGDEMVKLTNDEVLIYKLEN